MHLYSNDEQVDLVHIFKVLIIKELSLGYAYMTKNAEISKLENQRCVAI
ncbi:MAG: hypothetical protein ACI808_001096 [Paraglaciecola sp.]|jgi:hypothetical protein